MNTQTLVRRSFGDVLDMLPGMYQTGTHRNKDEVGEMVLDLTVDGLVSRWRICMNNLDRVTCPNVV